MKERLTITLSPDLVRQLDRLIDRRTVRSRSHAIETLLRQTLRPEVDTAVLLAGGRHKSGGISALSPIDGRPLIQITVNHLASHGVRRFLVLAGRNECEIRACLGEGEEFVYVAERRPLGTAGAIRQAASHLGDGPFLAVNADILTDIDVASFVRFHAEEKTLATIAVKPRQGEPNFGKVVLEGSRILEFHERSRDRGISIVNTGLYLLSPEVLDLIDDEKPSMLETDVFPRLAARRELGAFFFQGIWFDVGTPESRKLAEESWRNRGGRRHGRKG